MADTPQSDIYSAIMAAAVNFGTLERDAENPYYKSKYLSLAALLNAVRPALSDQGVLIQSQYTIKGSGFVVETSLLHLPSRTSVTSCFPVTDLAPQKVGAAGTFGLRYNLLQLLAIAPEDDDGNSLGGLLPGQADPLAYAGPPPSGQQRPMPQQLPQPGGTIGPAWLQGQQPQPQPPQQQPYPPQQPPLQHAPQPYDPSAI